MTGKSLDFMPVHYIRFLPHEVGENAALAEIEVTAIGDNIALTTFERGGTIRSGRPKSGGAARWNRGQCMALDCK